MVSFGSRPDITSDPLVSSFSLIKYTTKNDRKCPLYLDVFALGHQTSGIAAGRMAIEILIAPDDLIRLTKAGIASLIATE